MSPLLAATGWHWSAAALLVLGPAAALAVALSLALRALNWAASAADSNWWRVAGGRS